MRRACECEACLAARDRVGDRFVIVANPTTDGVLLLDYADRVEYPFGDRATAERASVRITQLGGWFCGVPLGTLSGVGR